VHLGLNGSEIGLLSALLPFVHFFVMLTTVALGAISRPGFWEFMGGVTRVLNISYLKAVPFDSTVHVHAHVYQVGRTMAYIKGWMTSEDGTTVYAACEHQKIYVPTRAEHMKHKIAWDRKFEGSHARL